MTENFVDSILPVEGNKRPIWSVMIPTYNSNEWLADTINSILKQDLGPEIMQIEVVDDASPKDDTKTFVKEIAGERIQCYVQAQNLGLVGNFTDCIKRARGHYVHILHGDDLVEDGFYIKNQAIFESNSEIGAVISRTKYINGDGSFRTMGPALQPFSGLAKIFKERYFTDFGINTPSVTVKRLVYEKLGGFDKRIANLGEDREMWSRVSRWFEIGYQHEPLAVYRIHEAALTKKIQDDGSILKDRIKSNEIVAEHFKGTEFEYLFDLKREKIARNAQISAAKALKSGNFNAFHVYSMESFRYYRSLKQVYWLSRALIDKSYK